MISRREGFVDLYYRFIIDIIYDASRIAFGAEYDKFALTLTTTMMADEVDGASSAYLSF